MYDGCVEVQSVLTVTQAPSTLFLARKLIVWHMAQNSIIHLLGCVCATQSNSVINCTVHMCTSIVTSSCWILCMIPWQQQCCGTIAWLLLCLVAKQACKQACVIRGGGKTFHTNEVCTTSHSIDELQGFQCLIIHQNVCALVCAMLLIVTSVGGHQMCRQCTKQNTSVGIMQPYVAIAMCFQWFRRLQRFIPNSYVMWGHREDRLLQHV